MGDSHRPADLQEAVERSYREQWGGRRFYLVMAIVFFVLALVSVLVLAFAEQFELSNTALKVVQISALTTGFVCLMAGVLFALESLIRWQREQGQIPDRTVHGALTLSMATVAGLVFFFFLMLASLGSERGIGPTPARIIEFIVFLFSGIAWFASVVMAAAGATRLLLQRSDLLEVNNTMEGTALLFRRGQSTEIVKLCVAGLVPLILYVIALLMAGLYLVRLLPF